MVGWEAFDATISDCEHPQQGIKSRREECEVCWPISTWIQQDDTRQRLQINVVCGKMAVWLDALAHKCSDIWAKEGARYILLFIVDQPSFDGAIQGKLSPFLPLSRKKARPKIRENVIKPSLLKGINGSNNDLTREYSKNLHENPCLWTESTIVSHLDQFSIPKIHYLIYDHSLQNFIT